MPRTVIDLHNHPSWEDGLDEIIWAKILRDTRGVCGAFMIARTKGLDAEWMAFFISGIRQGLAPITAAQLSLEELKI